MNMRLHASNIKWMISKYSLKLWGTITGKKVIVLVDSNAS